MLLRALADRISGVTYDALLARAVEMLLSRCRALGTIPDVSDVLDTIAEGIAPQALATRSRAYA